LARNGLDPVLEHRIIAFAAPFVEAREGLPLERVHDLGQWKGLGRPVACTLGNFDGFHLGHQALLDRLLEWGRLLELPAVVVTFDPHPAEVIHPRAVKQRLVPMPDRLRILEAMGVAATVVLKFDRALSQMSAEDFFHDVLVKRVGVRHLVLGPDSHYGHDRRGNYELSVELGAPLGMTMDRVEAVRVGEVAASSTLIRELVAAGRVAEIPQFLGRFFRVRGEVVKGKKRGTDLGFPTANVDPAGTLLPKPGVYAGQLWVDGRYWSAAISVGSNPTFGNGPVTLEAHALDFTGELYGRVVSVEFRQHLRDQMRFADQDQLIAQMKRDVAEVRRLAEAPIE